MNDVSGTARELPGLQGFEDHVEDDLGALLPRRSPPTQPTQSTAGGVAEPAVSTPPTPTASTSTGESTRRAGRRSKRTKADPDQAEPNTKPANGIRSSVMHVPVPLHQQLVAYREEHGISNGDVVIKAVAQAHPRLNKLIPSPDSSGGGIFQDRPSRADRTTAGPLTPLNVRLFEQDFTILDGMVEEFKAASRGHLVSVALSDFFSH